MQASSSLLSERQRAELNRSILAYLATSGVPSDTVGSISQIISPGVSPATNSDDTAKQASILEKKWTSVVRLQRKVLDLESQLSVLKEEIDRAPLSAANVSKKRSTDAVSWLPRPPPKHSFSGHRQPVTAVSFHPVFSVVASACEDGTLKIWDWELGELERTVKAHTKQVLDVDFSPAGAEILLASCSSDLTIKLWDPSNEYSNVRTLTGHDHTISSVRFAPSGTHLISASRDRTVRIWDVESGFAVRTIHGHSDWVKCAVPSFDGQFILSAGIDQSARISSFNSGEGKLLFAGHDHVVEYAAFAPATSYPYLAAIEGLKKPTESAYSQSFEYLATASRDKTIKIWNARQEAIATLHGHDNWVRALEFHPAGKYLISVSDDRSIRCWDLSQNGRCVKVIEDAHQHFVNCLRWAPPVPSDDSESKKASPLQNMRFLLATGSADMQVKIWA